MPSFSSCAFSSFLILKSKEAALLSLMPKLPAICLIGYRYQYRWIKMFRFCSGCSRRKRLIASTKTVSSKACSTPTADGMQSSSSDSTSSVCPKPRFSAAYRLNQLSDRFRTIFPRYAESFSGRLGGMESHAFKYVSFTHSEASSLL